MISYITSGTQIYGLVDPRRPYLVMYVGKTNNPARRLLNHINHARLRRGTPVNKWVLGLLEEGIRPDIITLQRCELKDWKTQEQFHIRNWRVLNAGLLNKGNGGEGQTRRESKKTCGTCGAEKEIINNTTCELACRRCMYASQKRYRARNAERLRIYDRNRKRKASA